MYNPCLTRKCTCVCEPEDVQRDTYKYFLLTTTLWLSKKKNVFETVFRDCVRDDPWQFMVSKEWVILKVAKHSFL